MTLHVEPDWWQTLFDEVYLVTDARSVCDDALTCREIDLVCDLVPLRAEHSILDLCGGHGRHSLELARRGFHRCTVFDYSSPLLERGRAQAAAEEVDVRFVQGDARATGLETESFDHVLIMGNSLGYLSEDDADLQILREARRLVRPGGTVLIDAADGEAIAASFKSNGWHEIEEDVVVCREREMQGHTLCAREMVLSKTTGLIRDRTYAIKLFDHESLPRLVEGAGLTSVTAHTDLFLHQRDGDYGFLNNRMILTALKAPA